MQVRSLGFGLVLLLVLAGAGCHHHEPIPGTLQMELVTNPAAPAAGALTRIRLLLTTGTGKPLDGAAAYLDLSHTGATAAPARVELAPRGNGVYAGQFTFPASGDWTGTLTAARQNRTEIRQYHWRVRPAAKGSSGQPTPPSFVKKQARPAFAGGSAPDASRWSAPPWPR